MNEAVEESKKDRRMEGRKEGRMDGRMNFFGVSAVCFDKRSKRVKVAEMNDGGRKGERVKCQQTAKSQEPRNLFP